MKTATTGLQSASSEVIDTVDQYEVCYDAISKHLDASNSVDLITGV